MIVDRVGCPTGGLYFIGVLAGSYADAMRGHPSTAASALKINRQMTKWQDFAERRLRADARERRSSGHGASTHQMRGHNILGTNLPIMLTSSGWGAHALSLSCFWTNFLSPQHKVSPKREILLKAPRPDREAHA